MSTMYKLGEIPVGSVTNTVSLSDREMARLKDMVFEQVKPLLPVGAVDVFIDLSIKVVCTRCVGDPLPIPSFGYSVGVGQMVGDAKEQVILQEMGIKE